MLFNVQAVTVSSFTHLTSQRKPEKTRVKCKHLGHIWNETHFLSFFLPGKPKVELQLNLKSLLLLLWLL